MVSCRIFALLCVSSCFLLSTATPVPPKGGTVKGKALDKAPAAKAPAKKPPAPGVKTSPGAKQTGKAPVGKACTPKGKAATVPKKTRRGWSYHGTNGANAQEYMDQSAKNRGLGSPTQFNGADSELGAGLYMTDDATTAQVFASGSAEGAKLRKDKRNKAQEPWICKLEMQDSNWIRMVGKTWIPFDRLARPKKHVNDPKMLAEQEALITANGQDPSRAVRFSSLAQGSYATNQAMIPPSTLIHITMESCVPLAQFSPVSGLNYRNLQSAWGIRDPGSC